MNRRCALTEAWRPGWQCSLVANRGRCSAPRVVWSSAVLRSLRLCKALACRGTPSLFSSLFSFAELMPLTCTDCFQLLLLRFPLVCPDSCFSPPCTHPHAHTHNDPFTSITHYTRVTHTRTRIHRHVPKQQTEHTTQTRRALAVSLPPVRCQQNQQCTTRSVAARAVEKKKQSKASSARCSIVRVFA